MPLKEKIDNEFVLMKILTDCPSLMFIHSFDRKHWEIIEANPFFEWLREISKRFL